MSSRPWRQGLLRLGQRSCISQIGWTRIVSLQFGEVLSPASRKAKQAWQEFARLAAGICEFHHEWHVHDNHDPSSETVARWKVADNFIDWIWLHLPWLMDPSSVTFPMPTAAMDMNVWSIKLVLLLVLLLVVVLVIFVHNTASKHVNDSCCKKRRATNVIKFKLFYPFR